MTPQQQRQVRLIFEGFLQRRFKAIRQLKLSDLDVNPFLIRVMRNEMGFETPRDIVRWLLQQRLERGTVTSFGNTLQDVAKLFSDGTAVEGADILKVKGGKRYHIQVKSGPNPTDSHLSTKTSELLQSAERRNRGSVALFAMCYGAPDRVSSVIKKYVKVDYLVGKQFWEFISDDPRCMREVYQIADEVSRTYKDQSGKTLKDVLAEKLEHLEEEFKQAYGHGPEMWDMLLERNP